MLGNIFALVNQIAATVQYVVQLLTRILAAIPTTLASDLDELKQTVTILNAILGDPTYGNAEIKAEIIAMQADVTTILADVVALGAPQQTGAPVTLPTSPPAGYGGLSGSATGDAVWLYQSSDENSAMGLIMSTLSVFLRVMQDSGAIPTRLGPGFSYNVGFQQFINNPNTSFFTVSITDIQPGDASLLDFLQRTAGSLTWNQTGLGTYWADVGSGNALIQCELTEGEFEYLRMLAGGPPAKGAPVVAPVWPGLAGVTLGTPVALAPGVTITTPMDGVLIDITSYPTERGKFTFDTKISIRNVGALAFFTDDGEEEFPQSLGFEQAVYCPKTMKRAAGVVLRTSGGFVGTVTPWLIS